METAKVILQVAGLPEYIEHRLSIEGLEFNVRCKPAANQNLLSVSAAVDLWTIIHTNDTREPTGISGHFLAYFASSLALL